MAKPFNALVSQVINKITNAGRIDSGIMRNMVGDELCQARASRLRMYARQGENVSLTPFVQTIPDLMVQVADFAYGGTILEERMEYEQPLNVLRTLGLPVERLRQYIRIPALISHQSFIGIEKPMIEYLGPPSGWRNIDIVSGNAYQQMQHRRVGADQPFILVMGTVAWLFGRDPIPWPSLVLRGVLADPRDAQDYGAIFDIEETPFPAPDDFANECVNELVNRDISMFGRAKKGVADGNNLTDA